MSAMTLCVPKLKTIAPLEAWRRMREYYPRVVFTARGYAKRSICRRRVSVCLSVTLRYCIKTAKCRITQTMRHDSPMTLVF